jgi:hypothetical protein
LLLTVAKELLLPIILVVEALSVPSLLMPVPLVLDDFWCGVTACIVEERIDLSFCISCHRVGTSIAFGYTQLQEGDSAAASRDVSTRTPGPSGGACLLGTATSASLLIEGP